MGRVCKIWRLQLAVWIQKTTSFSMGFSNPRFVSCCQLSATGSFARRRAWKYEAPDRPGEGRNVKCIEMWHI